MSLYARYLSTYSESKADLSCRFAPNGGRHFDGVLTSSGYECDFPDEGSTLAIESYVSFPDLLDKIIEIGEEWDKEHVEIVISDDVKDVPALIESAYKLNEERQVSLGFIFNDVKKLNEQKPLLEKLGYYVSIYSEPVIFEPKLLFCSKAKCSFDFCRSLESDGFLETIKDEIKLDKSFNEKLINVINKSGKTNVEIYTDAQISKQVFSSVMSGTIPKKDTIICLAVGLKLSLDDTIDLLNAAGYALSSSLLFDSIVRKHIEKKDWNIMSINAELDDNGLPLLGCKPRL